ncbi:Core histone macro-H2A.2 [Cichlidogyrus casuarinus]|uniref:Histone H2A n=1 Tax=Cichlidogyrus casuarinus TaxID=1844966 RepID=A0ABD2Q1Q9_9PLAT
MVRIIVAQRKVKRKSKSVLAGLVFSVARVHRKMKSSQFFKCKRLSQCAAVYKTAVIEYLTCELLELAGQNALFHKRKTITPKNIMQTILIDEDLKKVFSNVVIPQGGVLSRIQPELITKSKIKSTANSSYPATPKSTVDNRKKTDRQQMHHIVLSERTFEQGRKLCVIKGDITEMEVDAIVHPTSRHYHTNGMIGSIIMSKGGTSLQQTLTHLRNLGPLISLEAKCSEAPGLKAKNIIHVNVPTFSKSNQPASDLEKTALNCIRVAETEKLKRIALPSIGSGNAGYPKQLAAHTVLSCIRGHLKDVNSSIEVIYFVLYDAESLKIYEDELKNLQ